MNKKSVKKKNKPDVRYLEKMKNADKFNMRQVILDFPKQFRVGLSAGAKIKNQIVHSSRAAKIKNIDSIIICGVGGSVLSGELLKLLNANCFRSSIGINIHRNYGLPYYAKNGKQLIICISYSGNTEETISSYTKALERKMPVISIASGGKLEELSRNNRTPIAIIPSRIQPRLALGYQFAALLKILENIGMIKNYDNDLLTLEKSLRPEIIEKQGKNLSHKIIGKIPVIYASQNYKALAYFWKIKFNENSKSPAFWNYFPELNHNEMVGMATGNKKLAIGNNFHVIILRDSDEHTRIAKRMELTAKIFKNGAIETNIINLEGKNIFEKVFSNYILGDWTSYYLALRYGIDPTPVRIVEQFKNEMK